jgi:hypothetical protein
MLQEDEHPENRNHPGHPRRLSFIGSAYEIVPPIIGKVDRRQSSFAGRGGRHADGGRDGAARGIVGSGPVVGRCDDKKIQHKGVRLL